MNCFEVNDMIHTVMCGCFSRWCETVYRALSYHIYVIILSPLLNIIYPYPEAIIIHPTVYSVSFCQLLYCFYNPNTLSVFNSLFCVYSPFFNTSLLLSPFPFISSFPFVRPPYFFFLSAFILFSHHFLPLFLPPPCYRL